MIDYLKQEIKFLPGVGPKRAELLNKECSLFTFEDLLYYFPFKYVDRTQFYAIRDIRSNLPYIQVKGKIMGFRTAGEGNKQRLIADFTDATGTIELVWFKGTKWIRQNYKPGIVYIIFGKPSAFGGTINIIHPEIEVAAAQENQLKSSLQPFYSVSEKLKNNYISSKTFQKLMANLVLGIKTKIPDTLPDYLIQKIHLLPLHEALINVHFPENADMLKKATYRLKFEELFYIQLDILKQRSSRIRQYQGYRFTNIGYFFNTFYEKYLPFSLTTAQKKVVREIRRDVGSGKQMNRLLQGDVGSGKTLVSLMTMLIALDNGFQACLMAPTEILANQHYETISGMLQGMNVRVELLTGSVKKSKRAVIHEGLQNGDINILIGTHALLEDVVQFKNLGLVVIDEQHRFGVAQRARMWQKNEQPPHILVMTATPIPRTLAMTVYGDLDVSVIDELPPGRKPVKTSHVYENKKATVYNFLRQRIKAGNQVYIVYPLIKESEKMDYQALEEGYMDIVGAFPPPEYTVCMLHGQMKPEEKDLAMQQFVKGDADIMVATTVIEVGVDVPNASVMVIESAERFGLSQLHQLRGRVGRGADQSYCLLMTSFKLSDDSRKRIAAIVGSTDGFEIAEADLRLRGPGDLEGTMQSGIPFNLKLANLARDGQLLEYVRGIAEEILQDDPLLQKPKNLLFVRQLKHLKHKEMDWSVIS